MLVLGALFLSSFSAHFFLAFQEISNKVVHRLMRFAKEIESEIEWLEPWTKHPK